MAKNNLPAEKYAKPHTMSGGNVDVKEAVTKSGNVMDKLNISAGGISKGNYGPENKNGEITMRGAGAATKGTKCRGPMA